MLGLVKGFIHSNLIIIHKGVISAKIKSSLKLGSSIAPFGLILEKLTNWYLENFIVIWLICGAVFLDWLVGIGKHLICKTFSWKENGKGLLIKLFMVVAGGYLAEALPHFLGGENILSSGLIAALRLSIFMYPAASCWMNMSVITKGAFPPTALLEKAKNFNKNLNVKEFTDGKSSETN